MTSTEPFWQSFAGPTSLRPPPYIDSFPAAVDDRRCLLLPLRVLPGDGSRAVASLLVNHASFPVSQALAGAMAEQARAFRPDVIVGLPTLGLTLAPTVAQYLGYSNFVPLGYSRKFWYRDDLSVEISSVTSPGQGKRLYLDPHLMPRLANRRVVIVDDVVSRGTSLASARRLMEMAGVDLVGAVVAMAQTNAWRQALQGLDLRFVFASPGFEPRDDGFWPIRD